MFFLGISAHLFIYLLVPAFLVVCFYFRGTTGSPEVITLLPEMIVYESVACHSSEKVYVYMAAKQQENVRQTSDFNDTFIPQAILPHYRSIFYSKPTLKQRALRAPPAPFHSKLFL